MASLGERLREERVRRGLTLEQISASTKINPAMLAAIEAENFDQLPGGFFARSFVRQYARALDLDEAEFDAELSRLTASQPEPLRHDEDAFQPDVHGLKLRPQRRSGTGSQLLGRLFAFVLIVAVCSGVYVFWERSRQAGASEPAARASSDAATQSATPPPQQASQLPPAPAESIAEAGQQAGPAEQQASVTTGLPGAPPAQIEPAKTEPATDTIADAAPVRVELAARGEVWVRAVSGGRTQFEGTLQAGDARTFLSSEPITVKVGRPTSVELKLNGQPAGPLEPADRPLTIEFTRESFRILRPTAEPPATRPTAEPPAPRPTDEPPAAP